MVVRGALVLVAPARPACLLVLGLLAGFSVYSFTPIPYAHVCPYLCHFVFFPALRETTIHNARCRNRNQLLPNPTTERCGIYFQKPTHIRYRVSLHFQYALSRVFV